MFLFRPVPVLRRSAFLAALMGLALLEGCGGGGSNPPPAPPTAVAPPKAWGVAATIETDNAGDATDPQIAIDANGNALAVWSQSDGTRTNIMANRYSAASGTWGAAALIETDNGNADSPQIAIDGNGNALAVWPQHDGTRFNIWANRFQ